MRAPRPRSLRGGFPDPSHTACTTQPPVSNPCPTECVPHVREAYVGVSPTRATPPVLPNSRFLNSCLRFSCPTYAKLTWGFPRPAPHRLYYPTPGFEFVPQVFVPHVREAYVGVSPTRATPPVLPHRRFRIRV